MLTLSSSATIWARPVLAFWPISMRGTYIMQVPSGRICTHAAADWLSGKMMVGATAAARLRSMYSTVAPPAIQPVVRSNRRRVSFTINLPPAGQALPF